MQPHLLRQQRRLGNREYHSHEPPTKVHAPCRRLHRTRELIPASFLRHLRPRYPTGQHALGEAQGGSSTPLGLFDYADEVDVVGPRKDAAGNV
jgi:hypothetical protein